MSYEIRICARIRATTRTSRQQGRAETREGRREQKAEREGKKGLSQPEKIARPSRSRKEVRDKMSEGVISTREEKNLKEAKMIRLVRQSIASLSS